MRRDPDNATDSVPRTAIEIASSTASREGLPDIAVCDFALPVPGAPEVSIHVRNKRLPGKPVNDQKVVVFVHGASYAGSVVFDHPMFGGGSWLDYMAVHGFDAYVFDIRGYGRSSRPPEFTSGAGARSPYAKTADALHDLAAVVDFVRQRSGAAQVNLIGWSWGTSIAGGFAAEYGELVRNLVMVAPLWTIRNTPVVALSRWMMAAMPTPALGTVDFLGAFRNVPKAEARKRWVRGLEDTLAEQIMPAAEFDAWWQALSAVQCTPGAENDTVRVPNGVMADLIDIWGAGGATYTPERIRAPTQLLWGEWDVDTPLSMAQDVFDRLRGASYKRLEVLARGTHSMALELNRVDLYRRAREFLETRFN
ncbi:alpha/beta hydrolase [Ottowia sp. GY511]|uniref:Alpha/beta hydrolase n=1 Tax=Ottowia flava TaxID=2675430 RepID=A0ABW4KUJ6_9BURK|nr:alpha/beta fold hydrolase [Ottowia sp. GY511]TXK26659.1 alpha/beta hydrolase [Ottowia sp. GY511]